MIDDGSGAAPGTCCCCYCRCCYCCFYLCVSSLLSLWCAAEATHATLRRYFSSSPSSFFSSLPYTNEKRKLIKTSTDIKWVKIFSYSLLFTGRYTETHKHIDRHRHRNPSLHFLPRSFLLLSPFSSLSLTLTTTILLFSSLLLLLLLLYPAGVSITRNHASGASAICRFKTCTLLMLGCVLITSRARSR